MTASILVVDDVPANLKLLEAKLQNEYYDVITAKDGFEAIEITKKRKPDLILLDVMMPGIDGFETCKRLKADKEVSHIPIIMVTALSEQADRVRGLEAGADEFLTKPINDTTLFLRVKSLVRVKVLLDELRMRDQTAAQLGITAENAFISDVSGSNILLVDDDPVQTKQMVSKLNEEFNVTTIDDVSIVLEKAPAGKFDIILVSTLLSETDGLRLAMQIKGLEEIRHVPVLILVDEDDTRSMTKGLEMGINDYVRVPIDKNELIARVRTQIRRKRYQEALRSNYQQSISMAITDNLTGLYNRHYLSTHLNNLVAQVEKNSKPLSLIIMDMDHFKKVNDTYGHDVGDSFLKQLSKMIVDVSRSSDLVARFGGEEFVVLLPEADSAAALEAAERVRKRVNSTPFVVKPGETIQKTVSLGVATVTPFSLSASYQESAATLLKAADEALYKAKHGGRDQTVVAGS